MTKLIKELAQQAVEETQQLMIMQYKDFESELYKKFAELVVQECIDEIKTLRRNYDNHNDVQLEENDWYVDALLQAEVSLKQRFGV